MNEGPGIEKVNMQRSLMILAAICFLIAITTVVTLIDADNQLPVASMTPTAIPTPQPTAWSTPPPDQPITSIRWCGYTWKITDYNGGVFTSRNVWVDQDDNLHMTMIYENGTWKKFKLILDSTIGYSTFKWTVNTDVSYIQDTRDGGNPYFWFSPFLWDNDQPDNGNGEVDFEYCKWGNASSPNNCDWIVFPGGHHIEGRHVVGPYCDESMTWSPDYVRFTVEGPQQPYMEYTYGSSASPLVTGTNEFIINFGQWKGAAPPNNASYYETEVVMSNFEMTPFSNTSGQASTPLQENSFSEKLPPSEPVKYIRWSGYTWEVTDYNWGIFTSRNVWVDRDDNLHLKLIYENGTWHNFNLLLNDPVGYGTFKWRINSDVDYLQDSKDGGNPYLSFSQLLYDNSIPENNFGEIDVEHCKWGNASNSNNTDWVIWPDSHTVQPRHITGPDNDYTLEWTPGHIRFDVQGPATPYMEYMFTDTSRIPPATGQMRFILWLGQRLNASPPDNASYYETEVVLSNFELDEYVP